MHSPLAKEAGTNKTPAKSCLFPGHNMKGHVIIMGGKAYLSD